MDVNELATTLESVLRATAMRGEVERLNQNSSESEFLIVIVQSSTTKFVRKMLSISSLKVTNEEIQL